MSVPVQRSNATRGRAAVRRSTMWLRDWPTALACAFLLAVVLATFLAPLLPLHDALKGFFPHQYEGPSGRFLLGTDDLNRDLLSRLVFGAKPTVIGVAEATGVFLAVGVPLGLIAGFYGGLVDGVLMWIADLSFGIPQIVVVLAVVSIFDQSEAAAMLALGALAGFGLSRVVRTATLAVKAEEYVAAARVSGLSWWSIAWRHVFPRIVGTIIVQMSLFASLALLFQTGLEFLGLATHPPEPSWGGMVAEAAQFIVNDPWQIVPPGLAIAFSIFAFGIIGDRVRDVYADRLSSAQPLVAAGDPGTPAEHGPEGVDWVAGDVAATQAVAADLATDGVVADAPETLVPSLAATVDDAARALERPSSETVLTVRDLCVGLDRGKGPAVPLVDGVSFDVARGEALGIVGESGSGKSLTARSVLGLLPRGVVRTRGEVVFDGQTLDGDDASALRKLRGGKIGLIPQEPMISLDPNFTVGQQVAEVVRRHHGCSRREAKSRALELLGRVKLPHPTDVFGLYPHQLSGGIAQRVVIAAALAGDPHLLIADEPTTALDASTRAGILDLLGELQADLGVSLIVISHDWSVISRLANRVVVMYAGQIVERGEAAELFSSPRHPYTIGLLGSDPRLVTGGGRLRHLPGVVPSVGAWPVGCRFAARCAFADAGCRAQTVPEILVGAARTSRCIREDRVVAALAHEPEVVIESAKPVASANRPLLRVSDLSVQYRRGFRADPKRAVNDVSFEIWPGTTVGLVGESGSGKSTIARTVTGLVTAGGGTLDFDGEDLRTVSRRRRRELAARIQMVFQDPYGSLNPSRTIEQILVEPLLANPDAVAGAPKAAVGEALQRVGLERGAAQYYPSQFSGGQRQRIAIARALIVRPELIILDEAVSALDLSVQAQILNLLRDLQREEGLSYLFITHDMAVVRYLADHILVLKDGHVVESGATHDVMDNAQQPYTQELLMAAQA
jgi:peptide/nickel transport system permease protein